MNDLSSFVCVNNGVDTVYNYANITNLLGQNPLNDLRSSIIILVLVDPEAIPNLSWEKNGRLSVHLAICRFCKELYPETPVRRMIDPGWDDSPVVDEDFQNTLVKESMNSQGLLSFLSLVIQETEEGMWSWFPPMVYLWILDWMPVNCKCFTMGVPCKCGAMLKN